MHNCCFVRAAGKSNYIQHTTLLSEAHLLKISVESSSNPQKLLTPLELW